MKVTETIIIKVTRVTECTDYDKTLEEKMNTEQTKRELACCLKKEGLKLNKGDFIHIDVKTN